MKKTIILAVFVLLLALGAGLFFWLNPGEEIGEPKIINKKDFSIKELRDYYLVSNKQTNFSIKISRKKWKIEQNRNVDLSFRRNLSDNNYARIVIGITEEKITKEELEKALKSKFTWDYLTKNEFKDITIKNKLKAIKHIFEIGEENKFFIGVHIPNKKLYEIICETTVNQKDPCRNDFDEIINSISL